MSVNPSLLGKVRVKKESTYNDQLPSVPVSWDYTVECAPPSVSFALEVFAREAIRAGFYTLQPNEGSQYGGTLSLSFPMRGFSASAPTANPTEHDAAAFLRACLGSAVQTGYSEDAAVAAGSDGQTVVSAIGTASDYATGSAVLVGDGTTYRVGWVDTVTDGDPSTDSLDFSQDTGLSGVEDSSTIFGSNTIYLSTAALDSPQTFTVEFQMLTTSNRMVCGGWALESVSITADPRGQLMCEVSGPFCESVISSGSALSDFSYTYPLTPTMMSQNGARLAYGTSSPTLLDAMTLSIEITSTLVARNNPNSRQGVGGVQCTGRDVSVTYSVPIDGTTHQIENGLPTSLGFLAGMVGTAPGNVFAFALPNPVCVEVPEFGNEDDRYVQTYTWMPGQYTADTAGGDAANSPFRIAFL